MLYPLFKLINKALIYTSNLKSEYIALLKKQNTTNWRVEQDYDR